MTTEATLTIDIRGYWHPGTGRGHGLALDSVTHRNSRSLPALPGRTVKGLVRDAVYRWDHFGGYGEGDKVDGVTVTDQLFGPNEEGKPTWPGLLRFEDASLSDAEADYLAAHPDLAAGLYRHHHATAIDHESGTADERTLRSIELVVPLVLTARITVVEGARHRHLEEHWPELLKPALPLVRAVGAHRSRGLGRAELTLKELS